MIHYALSFNLLALLPLLLKATLAALEPCSQPDVAILPFCNRSLAAVDRANDLVSRLNVSEKIGQLMATAAPIERFHIEGYNWWSESLHGIDSYCTKQGRCATSYPLPIGLGASFNLRLVKKMASQISSEGRRFFVEDVGGTLDRHLVGLDFWGPNINIFRDPRWGRGMETPGEDPYLNAQYAVAYIQGMQEGEDSRYLKTIATLKHYAGYSVESGRCAFDASITDQDLVQTYLPAFEAGIKEGKAGSVMCSYNAVNGIPSCANSFLLQGILRDQWDWDGYVVSDCGAIGCVQWAHHYMPTPASASTVSLKAGTDLNCGTTYQHLEESFQDGNITQTDLDKALLRLFTARMRLGMFDPWDQQPYLQYPPDTIGHPDHLETALQAARESIVLLKNDAGVLPLDAKSTKKLAVLGPHFNATWNMCGNYHGALPPIINPMQALKAALVSGNVVGMQGCDINSNNTQQFQTASTIAADADVAILFMGISIAIEQENKDRTEIGLPGVQEAFIEEIAKVQKNTIVVLINGGSLDVSGAKANQNVVAIVEAFYPGIRGGEAIADVLFGKYNPSGRLPYTMHKKDFVNQIPMKDMSMSNYPGRTYRYFKGEVVYPFGFGLSYTTFSYTAQAIINRPEKQPAAGEQHYRVNVTNTGDLPGDTSVLVFMSFDSATNNNKFTCPHSQLVAFQKVSLGPGESKVVFFSLSVSGMRCYHSIKKTLGIPAGWYSIRIADERLMLQHLDDTAVQY